MQHELRATAGRIIIVFLREIVLGRFKPIGGGHKKLLYSDAAFSQIGLKVANLSVPYYIFAASSLGNGLPVSRCHVFRYRIFSNFL